MEKKGGMMPDKGSFINELCSITPCVIGQINGGGFQVNWGKVVQALIIVAIIAASTSMVTTKVLEADFENLEANIEKRMIRLENDISNNSNKLESVRNVQIEFDKTFNGVAKDVVDMKDDFKRVNNRLDRLEDER